MTKTVVKVQVPMSAYGASEEDALALIYNRDRSLEIQVPVMSVYKKMGKEFKKYFYANVSADSMHILGEAPMQNW